MPESLEEDRKARYEERETERKQRNEEREIERKQRNEEREKLRDEERKRLEQAGLLGKIKGVSEELDKLARRVALLEAERNRDQQGTA